MVTLGHWAVGKIGIVHCTNDVRGRHDNLAMVLPTGAVFVDDLASVAGATA